MEKTSALFLLLLAQTPDPVGPSTSGDLPYSHISIENSLNGALEKLVKAGTYTCQHDSASKAFAPVQRGFDLAVGKAKRVLGHDLDLDIWTNSCRKEGDSAKFRSLLRAAERELRKSERLIEAQMRDDSGNRR